MRLTGCLRCGSNNHEAVNCTRFGYYDGPRCVHCHYLHKKEQCPVYVKDRQRQGGKDNYRNVKSVELEQRQQDNTLAVAQPGTQLPLSNVTNLQDANLFEKTNCRHKLFHK